ncbi:hypothetical protein [Demequina activiva]|uniref:Uncharacterized protein n=1 Tax=Demequina activiva TaxID=1582364 RepID=A0A919UK75_9MICO|nr:hypothetical protein [Demequina activiva]GIG54640.1 hypothetical protein Dac01nite_13920 [Demequina activiva]
MLLVTPASVGETGYARMAREGVIAPLLRGVGLPRDIAPAPALRRLALASIIPAGSQATALAALWGHGCGPPPTVIDVRCTAGTVAPAQTSRSGAGVVTHVITAWPSHGSPPVAAPLAAAVDALVWSPLDLAVPTVLCAVDAGLLEVRDLRAASRDRDDTGLAQVERALEWRAQVAPPVRGVGQARLEPVMRRAS